MGVLGWIDAQLAAAGPDPAVEATLGAFRTLGVSRQELAALRSEDGDPLRRELTHSMLVRACSSRHQLHEMMSVLWMDHFNVSLNGQGRWRHLVNDYQEQVIRPNALGRFEDLLRATAHAPAMLVYLDNHTSNASRPNGVNENYGRELLELHTLGIDSLGGHVYTEADIQATAKLMSGWSVQGDDRATDFSDFRFVPGYHSTESISLLGGEFRSPSGGGKDRGDVLLGFLAHHPSTARHVSTKLIRRFVTDNPSSDLIESTATVYLANDTALAPTLRHVLLSREFAESQDQKLRRPFELVVAALRAVGASVPADPASVGARTLHDRLRRFGHEPWDWPAPDGFPDTAAPWLNADALLGRWSFLASTARMRLTSGADSGHITNDLPAMRATAATVGGLLAAMTERFGLGPLTTEQIVPVLTAVRRSADEASAALDDEQVREIASLVLTHPGFQVR